MHPADLLAPTCNICYHLLVHIPTTFSAYLWLPFSVISSYHVYICVCNYSENTDFASLSFPWTGLEVKHMEP